MRRRLASLLTAAALLACGLAAVSADAHVGKHTRNAGHLRIAVNNGADLSNPVRDAQLFDRTVVRPWDNAYAQRVEAEPGPAEVCTYTNLSMIGTGETVGVTNTEAPESWYLHDWNGSRLYPGGWPYLNHADVEEAGYRQRWVDNVIPRLKSRGFDCVFLDDTNVRPNGRNASEVSEYGGSASRYTEAMRGMLAFATTHLRANGIKAIGNIGAAQESAIAPVARDWTVNYLDGVLVEHYMKWGGAGEGYMPFAYDENKLIQDAAEANRKEFWGRTTSSDGDTAAARWGYATILQNARGHSFQGTGDHEGTSAFPIMLGEYNYDLGAGKNESYINAKGERQRDFECGSAWTGNASTWGWVSQSANCTPTTSPPPTDPPPPGSETPTSGASFEGEDMTLPGGAVVFSDSSASGGKGVVSYPNGTLSKRHTTAGAKRIIITAKSDSCDGDAHMTVRVDGQQVLSQTVAPGGWKEYSAPAILSDGDHKVEIAYDNDLYRPGVCDRNLRLDKVAFSSTVETSFEGEAMTLPGGVSIFSDSAASGGRAVVFLPNGTATGQHTTSGARRITVRARSDSCDGHAHMVVRVDGQQVLSQTLTSSSWQDYSAPLTLPNREHTVTVTYDNDLYRPGVCDRNLRLDKVTFSSA